MNKSLLSVAAYLFFPSSRATYERFPVQWPPSLMYSIRSAIEVSTSPCFSQKGMRSSTRAIVPSSFTTSQREENTDGDI